MPGSFEQAMASDNGSVTSSSQLRLVRSIRLARALRRVRVVRLFRYVSALRWDMVGYGGMVDKYLGWGISRMMGIYLYGKIIYEF